jgi:hypothetical protein
MASGVVGLTGTGNIWASFTCNSYSYFQYLDGDKDEYDAVGRMKLTPSRFGLSDLAFLHAIPTFAPDTAIFRSFSEYASSKPHEVELVPIKVGRSTRWALRVLRRESGSIKGFSDLRAIFVDTALPKVPGFFRLASVPELFVFYKFESFDDEILESIRSASGFHLTSEYSVQFPAV